MNRSCGSCGKQIEGEGAAFCPYCGAKLTDGSIPEARNPEAEKWVGKALAAASYPERKKILEKGLEALKTKDSFGRDVIDPNYGIRIRFDNFGDSSVDVAVKQLVLVPEQIEFRYRCRELIYNILAENGFTIPFPQRDVHMIDDNK